MIRKMVTVHGSRVHGSRVHGSEVNCLAIFFFLFAVFLVPMLQRGNAYHICQSPLADAGAWEPGNL